MDWLQNNIVYFFGWNGALQSGVVALLGVIISVGVSWYIARKKIEMEKENYTEQVRQFEDNLANERLKIYKELITKERLSWIVEIRKEIIEYLTLANYIIGERCKFLIQHDGKITLDDNLNFILSCERSFIKLTKTSYAIQVRMNPYSSKNKNETFIDPVSFTNAMISLSNKIRNFMEQSPNVSSREIRDNLCGFAELCQKMLHSEWKHAQIEAKSIYEEKSMEGHVDN